MNKIIICFICFLLVFGLIGCSSKTDNVISTDKMEMIYAETVSANNGYAEKEEDIVNYTVEIYQDKNNKILVNSKSNTDFFEPLQYEVECNTRITKSDIDMEWTTLMGNPEPTEDDQLCIAYVSVSENGKLLDKRKISFVNRAIDVVENVW